MENQLALIEQVPAIAKSLPETIGLNHSSLEKAKTFGENLYAEIAEKGMSDEYDKQVNDFLCKLKTTVKTCNDRRSPITKFFDSIRDSFTAIESELSPKSPLYIKGQTLRDNYAADKRKKAEEEERQRQLKINQETERIEVEAKAKEVVSESYLNQAQTAINKLNDILETSTLETIDNSKVLINGFSNDPMAVKLEITTFSIKYIELSEALTILENVIKSDLVSQCENNYREAIQEAKAEVLAKIPGKIEELKTIAAANAEQKKKLEEQAAARKKAEEDRIASEQKKKLEEQQAKIEAEKQSQTVNSLFDITQQPGEPEKVAQGVESYEIRIKDVKVLPIVFQFWWTRDGQHCAYDKIEKKTISSMVGFAEKWAKSKGEFIQSDMLEYVPVYKTKAISK